MTTAKLIPIPGQGGHHLMVDGYTVNFHASAERPASVQRNACGRFAFISTGNPRNALDIWYSEGLDLHPITDWSELHPMLGSAA
jgi:hypothetical protein